jgi:flagellar protein FliL
MAEGAAAAPAEGATPGGEKKSGMMIGILILAGALLGGLLATFVVAPRIIARQAPATAGDSANSGEAAKGGEASAQGKGKEGEAGSENKLVQLANIIVNPAGSQGSRFLMTSVAISVGSEEAQKVLSERQVELRDKITTILETQTMAQLTMPGERDSLKLKISAVAQTMVGPKVPLKVFLPQFVIQ